MQGIRIIVEPEELSVLNNIKYTGLKTEILKKVSVLGVSSVYADKEDFMGYE